LTAPFAFLQHEGVHKLKLAQALRAHREALQKELAQDDAYQLVARFATDDHAEEAKAADRLAASARLSAELAEKERELRKEQKAPLASAEQMNRCAPRSHSLSRTSRRWSEPASPEVAALGHTKTLPCFKRESPRRGVDW
jgi:hypothetical protein